MWKCWLLNQDVGRGSFLPRIWDFIEDVPFRLMIVWDVVEFDLKKKKGLGCGEGKILEKVLLLKRQYLLIKFTLSSISIYYVLLGDSKKGEFNT